MNGHLLVNENSGIIIWNMVLSAWLLGLNEFTLMFTLSSYVCSVCYSQNIYVLNHVTIGSL